jgi:hypothetical protein
VSVVIFRGPTLSAAEVQEVLPAQCLPPAAQGDVYRAAVGAPRAIGIIDGFFERMPSVWHKEILWAMSRGIHVFGSASMGALRAAELAPLGMVGVGAIFEAYRDGILEDDDEVAVVHGPTEESYWVCSEAMVNFRATLTRAVDQGVVSQSSSDALLRIAKALFYPHRAWDTVLERASDDGLPGIDAFREWLPSGRVNQKREDALAMLGAMRDFLATDPGPKQVWFPFQETVYWQGFVCASTEARLDPADQAVLDELSRDPAALARTEPAALGWFMASERARRRGRVLAAEDVLQQSREFCARHGVTDAAELSLWMERHRCGSQDLNRLLEASARVLEAMQDAPAAMAAALLDYLRWTGDYGELLDRARQAARSIADRDPQPTGRFSQPGSIPMPHPHCGERP